MSSYGFILLIILIGGTFILGIVYITSKAESNKKRWEKSDAAMRDEINDIKRRLVTLEKIVTDKSYQLHDEIDNL